jgi:hypothetical protein
MSFLALSVKLQVSAEIYVNACLILRDFVGIVINNINHPTLFINIQNILGSTLIVLENAGIKQDTLP